MATKPKKKAAPKKPAAKKAAPKKKAPAKKRPRSKEESAKAKEDGRKKIDYKSEYHLVRSELARALAYIAELEKVKGPVPTPGVSDSGEVPDELLEAIRGDFD